MCIISPCVCGREGAAREGTLSVEGHAFKGGTPLKGVWSSQEAIWNLESNQVGAIPEVAAASDQLCMKNFGVTGEGANGPGQTAPGVPGEGHFAWLWDFNFVIDFTREETAAGAERGNRGALLSAWGQKTPTGAPRPRSRRSPGAFISSGCLPRSLHQSRSVPESSQGPHQTSSPAALASSAWSWPAALPSPANSSVRNFRLPGRPCRCHREARPTEERPGPPRHLAGHRVGLKVADRVKSGGSRLALPAAKEPRTTAPVSAAIKSVVSGEVGASLANRKLNSRKKKLPAARHSHRPDPRARQAPSSRKSSLLRVDLLFYFLLAFLLCFCF